jgi:iron only hydrogenase large subunit-like protein
MIKEAGIDFDSLEPESMDLPMGFATGAGMIFGNSAVYLRPFCAMLRISSTSRFRKASFCRKYVVKRSSRSHSGRWKS